MRTLIVEPKHFEDWHVVIASMCQDADESIARMALRELIRRRWSGLAALMMRLVTSPHPEVRKIAERHLVPVGFDRFWEHFERMDPTHLVDAL